MKAHGLLVLDAHKNPIDILMTSVWIRRAYSPKQLIMPIAGYLFYIPICKQLLRMYAKKYSITTIPVYRISDTKPNGIISWFLTRWYPPTLSDEKRKKANNIYLQTIATTLPKRNVALVVSPFGGYSMYGKKIKRGVDYARSLHPKIILTKTRFYWKRITFITRSTEFNNYDTNLDMLKETLLQKFSSL